MSRLICEGFVSCSAFYIGFSKVIFFCLPFTFMPVLTCTILVKLVSQAWSIHNSFPQVFSHKLVMGCIFYYQGFHSQTLTIHRMVGKGGEHPYSALPLPHAHEHSDIHLHICMWDVYHEFLIAPFVITKHCYSMWCATLGDYHLINSWWNINFCLFT